MVVAKSAALSAISAFQKKLNVTADNIANSRTDGYKRERAILSEAENGGVKAQIIKDEETPGPVHETYADDTVSETEGSNVDLVDEMAGLITVRHAYQANLATLKTEDEMLGRLIDIMG